MKPTDSTVESLLKQMPLVEPSSTLDQAIFDLTHNQWLELPQGHSKLVGPKRFGWVVLASTAVAATLFGLVLGQFVSIYRVPGSEVASIHVPGNPPSWISKFSQSRQIVPVKFSVAAFELMHGHSRRAEFVNCASCHRSDDQQEEAFEGWYYGDQGLFETHGFKGGATCSACHLFWKSHPYEGIHGDPSKPDLPDLHGFASDFFDSECSACHVASPG